MTSISIFCGSSSGNDPAYCEQARLLGKTLAERQIQVVYGGAKVGVMGAVAEGVLQAGGKIIGVIPTFLQDVEVRHGGLTEMIVVKTMHQRKALMHDLSDATIALHGGFGTMDELFEILTWGQLGLHTSPIGLLNTAGYYDNLLQMIDNMTAKGLLKPANREMLVVHEDIETLLGLMAEYEPPREGKWID